MPQSHSIFSLFFYFTSVFLAKVFHCIRAISFLQRKQDGCEYVLFSDGEEDNNEYCQEQSIQNNRMVDDIIGDGEALPFLPTRSLLKDQIFAEEIVDHHQPMFEEPEDETYATEHSSIYTTPASESENNMEEMVDLEHILRSDTNSAYSFEENDDWTTSPTTMVLNKSSLVINVKDHDGNCDSEENENMKVTEDENYLFFAPSELKNKKYQLFHEQKDSEEFFGEWRTAKSNSKSSSEWKSSTNCKDSGTEDRFSCSSNWGESYTVLQRYDKERLFLDRASSQRLLETESVKSIETCPRSMSERIVHNFGTKNKRSSEELEAAYVAQICLTWEALNWNYKYFQRARGSCHEFDPGCPAHIAQQFQQFQVLLQRYIENEPYEHGCRPEVYARIRSLAPKLLQVPEYRDSNDEQKEEVFGSRISSVSFLVTMEEAIRTFMKFLKADRKNRCQLFASFIRRNRRGSIDRTLLLLLKKVNKKKKLKLKDLRRARMGLRKRTLKEEEEMEILMAQIDLKVVSRVLKMSDLKEEQLHWCEDKISKVRVCDGKLQRDSSPLFFPAH
ncbi:uncharacterized protein LOC132307803 [Cornus florida]|uniref:uncharacterized protein LOC132307803 n=1 Tax=Cornus florida TaxID=4283 RepID=UPI00289F7709|nr:uncharacterized protein LOC132307803 [Cornus florida]